MRRFQSRSFEQQSIFYNIYHFPTHITAKRHQIWPNYFFKQGRQGPISVLSGWLFLIIWPGTKFIYWHLLTHRNRMFEIELAQLLVTIAHAESKMEEYRQLLNEEIQFNLKDLYVEVCGRSAMANAYHLHVFMHDGDVLVDVQWLESLIKGYNNCTSMNLTFMEFSLMFLSRQNRLLAKLALERDSLGPIPSHLLAYSRKLIELEANLHQTLGEFRKQFSSPAEKWIRQNSSLTESSGIQQFNKAILDSVCSQVGVDSQIIIQHLCADGKNYVSAQRMLSLFTLKNCETIERYLKKKRNQREHEKVHCKPGEQVDPFIRPEFHDCLQRPKTTELFSFRQVKSIQKHLDRLNSRNKHELTQKISRYRSMVEKQLVKTCQAVKELIQLQKLIQNQRVELRLCTDFYPVLFFESLQTDRAGLLIPSALKDYLEKMGVSIPLQNLYLIFKRFSSRSDGKLDFNEFCSLFDVSNSDYTRIEKNRQVRGLADVELETKKHFLNLFKVIASSEKKAEKVRVKLLQAGVNLRDVFSVFDSDEDGYISQLDFQIVWKKFLLMELPSQDISLLWHRMKARPQEDNMLRYDRFIVQLAPKAKWVSKGAAHCVTK